MFIIDDILKGLGQKKAAKEATRASEQQNQANYESGVAAETNKEDDRLGRMGFITSQLKGNRAMTPEQIAQIMKRRAITTRKGATLDSSKGVMFNTLGNAAGAAGQLGVNFLTGLGVNKELNRSGGSAPTTLLPGSSNPFEVAPIDTTLKPRFR